MLLTILDLFGTAVFAITGGFKAVKHELDILGLLVLSTITGVGGGIFRDLILGDTPPTALKDEKYIIICLVSGLAVFFMAPHIAKGWKIVKMGDAIGLGVFTVIGAAKGMDFDLGIAGIILTGTLTATGGGMIRDLLVREIPSVLIRDFYATAAVFGCLVFYFLQMTDLNQALIYTITICSTTALRLIAMKTKISLPRVKQIPGFKGSSE